jgi:membrane associated rhomboid family serine protease
MTGLSMASATSLLTPREDPLVAPDDDVSPEVMRGLHADAVRLNRAELSFIIPTVVVAILAGSAAIVAPRSLWFLWGLIVPVSLKVAQWAAEWWRLRTTDPIEHFHRERRQDLDQAAGVADYQARATARKPGATIALMAGISVVTAAQFLASGLESSVAAAGLVKDATRAGEWWRLLTASYLHVNYLHFAGNMTVVALLGEMIEAYDRRLRVPLAYLAGVIGGGLLSLLLVQGTSIGASAGVLGLAGYLLVFTHRRRGDGSGWLRKRVLGVLAAVAVFGVLGFFFVDNAAHLGGLLAGVLVGVAAAPVAAGDPGPDSARVVDVAGWTAVAVLVAGAAFTLAILMQ